MSLISKKNIFKKRLFESLVYLAQKTFLTAEFKELDKLQELTIHKLESYEALHTFSIRHPSLFWGTLAKTRLSWFKDFNEVTSGSFKNVNDFSLKWFIGGKLNVAVNCVDRHYFKEPDRVAFIWEKDEPGTEERITYKELYQEMNQFANMLKSYGIKKGDRVAIYMPNSIMIAVTMLACARIGAVHVAVFAGFAADSLSSRINDSECVALVTMNQGIRGGKLIDLKTTVDSALQNCPSIKHAFVFKRTENKFERKKQDIVVDEVLDQYSTECPAEMMDSEDPLFILYTSGSTGKPKGVVHTQAGYLLHSALSLQLVFDYKPTDVFGCLTDIGWITGHSYAVYAPLCNGGTSILFESTPTYPDPGRYWDTVERLKINQLYISPTSIRMLLKYGDEWVKKYKRSSLKILGTVGEPINREAWSWYYEVVGEKRCFIADTWWQTETGAISISPLPANITSIIKPSMAMRPFFGIETALLDDKGKELEKENSEGALCIKQPWPGMCRTINGDHSRFIETYLKKYPGYYYTGDGARTDSDGDIQITGRIDDVMNVSGHRIGTAEVEDILQEHEEISESAVVGYPHETHGEGIYAYIVPKDTSSSPEHVLIKALKSMVKKKISSHAVPHNFLIVSNLPKTTSGKTMRRILRKIAENKHHELGDTSTLSEPLVVDEIIKLHTKKHKKTKII